ncbi:MAG: APC family permease [Actinobacteria bacterium]|nr:APC family permease [Actinomycetota bacterium]MCB8995969.1 APC family permease [Actinomycetota bacterium]MCB9415270.1 APC family permease [Actinomycetota bacterium]MCB9424140.1 APC family permease [Actinomycetota bacterium]HRY10024.1 APC family permease [Candidatus Nanopelagicales bacterium]
MSASSTGKANISLVSAAAMGVGGMMGAGLYTLLGLATVSTGSLLPFAFLAAGFAAAFSVYSYAKLGSKYPSRGGAAEFLLQEFGEGVVSGGLNVFQYVAYLIATALYAAGFAEYMRVVLGGDLPSWAPKAIGAGIVLVFMLVNIVGTKLVGRAETAIIAIEAAILLGFVVLGVGKADFSQVFGGEHTNGALGVITGAALLYVTYQGFGVVTNTSGEMLHPNKELPRAMFSALAIVAVVYLVVSTLVVSLLSVSKMQQDAGHVLADAGEAVLGNVGFLVISGAAILATASAVNATIFAASNIGYDVSQNRQISAAMTRTVWRSAPVSLFVSALVTILFVVFFPLSAVGQMTSLAFLVVYGAVSYGHLRLRAHTGAKAWPLWTAVVLNSALFIALLVEAVRSGSPATWITLVAALIGSFAFEWFYRRRHPAGG